MDALKPKRSIDPIGPNDKEKFIKAQEITKKKKMISSLEKKIRMAASLDIVFLLEYTRSMETYIEATKKDIDEISTIFIPTSRLDLLSSVIGIIVMMKTA